MQLLSVDTKIVHMFVTSSRKQLRNIGFSSNVADENYKITVIILARFIKGFISVFCLYN